MALVWGCMVLCILLLSLQDQILSEEIDDAVQLIEILNSAEDSGKGIGIDLLDIV